MYEADVVYREEQRFRQWWLWGLLTVLTIFWIVIILMTFDVIVILSAFILDFGLILFMYKLKLDTEVTDIGIKIRFWPFHREWLLFEFKNIESFTEVKYKPLVDYGGWGIRYGIFDRLHAKAYTVSGNRGIMIQMRDNNNVLIGSQCSSEFYSSVSLILDGNVSMLE